MAIIKRNKKVAKTVNKLEKNIEKNVERGVREAQKMGDELMHRVSDLKKKYDSLDGESKKKIMRGVVGVAAVLASMGAIRKARKKNNE